MKHSIVPPAVPARATLRKHALATLALLALTACGGAGDTGDASPTQAEPPARAQANIAETPAQPAPDAVPAMPAMLSEVEQRSLLEDMARSYPAIEQLRHKEETGEVRALRLAREAKQLEANLERARVDLDGIKKNLAGLSQGGLQTYALLHFVGTDGRLKAWLIFPDGGVVAGATKDPYSGLGELQGGLGVERIAETRGPQLKGQEKQRLDADEDVERGASGPRDNSPEALRKRQETLSDAVQTLLPGDVRQVLAAGQGRLLVVPTRDTGTAPYAALPIRSHDDFAARRWSFVVMQDLDVLAGSKSGVDLGHLDFSKSVIVGDPEDMRDVQYTFPALPGARAEAKAIAEKFGVDPQRVFIGADATRKNVVRALERSNGQGVIFMATHAIADPEHPLTRGFVVLSQQNLFAGELRYHKFRGWDQHPPLVVMSACQTALGRVFDGGTFGVARIWTNAGAGQVVASLWNVSDKATYLLMTRFVTQLQKGMAPELAMQAAQLETIKNYPDDPKMWASFTIIGKPTNVSGNLGQSEAPTS